MPVGEKKAEIIPFPVPSPNPNSNCKHQALASFPNSPQKGRGRVWYRFARDIAARRCCTNYQITGNVTHVKTAK